MRPPGAELVESREIAPGRWQLAWRAPAIAAAARAGQVVHVRTVEAGGMPLRRPFAIASAEPAAGTLSVEVPGRAGPSRGTLPDWAAELRPGDSAELVGPLGRPLEIDPRSRHLLAVAQGPAIAALRLLVAQAVRDGRSVVVLYGAATAADVYPSSLLPDEAEYAVATADGSLGHRGSVEDLVLDYDAWADQAFAAGPPALLARLAALAAGRRERLGVARLGRKRGGGRPTLPGSAEARRKSHLQVILDHSVGCAAGTCLTCVVPGVAGPVRVCREGPAFAADEIDWERLA